MRRTASFGERAEIARAIADPGVPDPVLNPDPGAVNALAEGRPRADTEGLAGKSARAIEEKILLTPTEAAAFLNLKPFTLSRYRAVGDGPRVLQARSARAVFPGRSPGLGQTPGKPS